MVDLQRRSRARRVLTSSGIDFGGGTRFKGARFHLIKRDSARRNHPESKALFFYSPRPDRDEVKAGSNIVECVHAACQKSHTARGYAGVEGVHEHDRVTAV